MIAVLTTSEALSFAVCMRQKLRLCMAETYFSQAD